MAIKLNSTETMAVLSALSMYRDALQNPPWWFVPKGDGSEDVAEIERLEKSYRRSLGALRRLGK
jgi:hypothetical protein